MYWHAFKADYSCQSAQNITGKQQPKKVCNKKRKSPLQKGEYEANENYNNALPIGGLPTCYIQFL